MFSLSKYYGVLLSEVKTHKEYCGHSDTLSKISGGWCFDVECLLYSK